MPTVKTLRGVVHKYHKGSKYTDCGKKIKRLWTHGKSNKRCPECWL